MACDNNSNVPLVECCAPVCFDDLGQIPTTILATITSALVGFGACPVGTTFIMDRQNTADVRYDGRSDQRCGVAFATLELRVNATTCEMLMIFGQIGGSIAISKTPATLPFIESNFYRSDWDVGGPADYIIQTTPYNPAP